MNNWSRQCADTCQGIYVHMFSCEKSSDIKVWNLSTDNWVIKRACPSVTLQLITCQIVFNLANIQVAWQTVGLPWGQAALMLGTYRKLATLRHQTRSLLMIFTQRKRFCCNRGSFEPSLSAPISLSCSRFNLLLNPLLSPPTSPNPGCLAVYERGAWSRCRVCTQCHKSDPIWCGQ